MAPCGAHHSEEFLFCLDDLVRQEAHLAQRARHDVDLRGPLDELAYGKRLSPGAHQFRMGFNVTGLGDLSVDLVDEVKA